MSSATEKKPKAETAADSPPSAANTARYVYGILDIVLGVAYLAIFTWLVPSRSAVFTTISSMLSLLLVAGGVGMFVGGLWGRRIATIAAATMVVACVVLLLLLAASAAYLHGIYDGIGQAGVVLSGIVALLAIELVGLVPTLQLVHLWRTRKLAK